MKTQVKTWMDFAAWSPAPWTSDQAEPVPVMAAKARFLGAQTLQTQWNIQVRSFSNPVEHSGEIFMTPALYLLHTSTQAPATHPNGVGVAGHAKMLPEASQLPPIPFFSAQNIKVKVSLC